MKQFSLLFIFLNGMVLIAQAQEVSSTSALGYVKLTVAASTDNPISIPLLHDVASYGFVASVTSNTVTIQSGSWQLNQFVYSAGVQSNHYEIEFISGNLAGLAYPITTNTQDTLTLNTGSDDITQRLGGVATGDIIAVRPEWTVAQLFGSLANPPVLLNPFTAPPTLQNIGGGDALFFPDNVSIGLDKPYLPSSLGFVQSTGWRLAGDATDEQGDTILPPASVFFVRHQAGQDLTVLVVGDAPIFSFTTPVFGGNGVHGNDFALAPVAADPLPLSQSGLFNPNPVVGASTSLLQPDDELLGWSGRRGFNRAPDQIFYNVSGTWYEQGNSRTSIGTDVLLQPGSGYLVRKRSANGNQDWIQGTP